MRLNHVAVPRVGAPLYVSCFPLGETVSTAALLRQSVDCAGASCCGIAPRPLSSCNDNRLDCPRSITKNGIVQSLVSMNGWILSRYPRPLMQRAAARTWPLVPPSVCARAHVLRCVRAVHRRVPGGKSNCGAPTLSNAARTLTGTANATVLSATLRSSVSASIAWPVRRPCHLAAHACPGRRAPHDL